ncbi:alpha/beta hydrolase [Archangium minus]|uniref:Alpha/beta hydrolase n=1 Tax=Archangium minus TaxID=83450 RepID=A0ABY9X9D3_9BACT|nr:alpha/beta hydrolase [Archangium minus]
MSAQIQYVETPFGRLAYTLDGEDKGVPLLLVQRFRGTIDDWDPRFVSALAARRRVIRFDNAGIGRSSGQVPDTIEGMAEVALAFTRALGIERADVLGWSLGGLVAQHITLAAPAWVRRLIIAGSTSGGGAEGPAQHPRVPEVMTKPVNDEEDFLFLFFTGTETGRAAGKAHLARLNAQPQRGPLVSGESFMRQVKAISRWPGVRDRLGELTQPILVANGVSDVMIPAYRSYVISQQAPNAKLVLYPDSGHAFLFQYIEEFTDEVHRFLS